MLLGSTVIETALALVFVYFFFSAVCSGIVEMIAARRELRARNLDAALDELLGSLKSKVLAHPATGARVLPGRPPSYLDPRLFAAGLLAVITESSGERPDSPDRLRAAIEKLAEDLAVRRVLLTLLDDAEGDRRRLRELIMDWYQGAMDRIAGRYKRQVTSYTIGVALALSLAFNLDSIRIAEAIHGDAALRAGLTAMVETTVNRGEESPVGEKEIVRPVVEVSGELQRLGMPIGWQKDEVQALADGSRAARKIAGLVLSTLALMLGSPFWFDLMKRFVNLRGVGPKPGRASKTPPG
ncbi:MAG: hypothetical protein QM820_60880 [Minicystis sp.]